MKVAVLGLHFLYVIGRVAIVPILASFALGYLLDPIVSQGAKLSRTRPIAVIGAVLIVTLALVAFLAFVIPDLWEQGTRASQKVTSKFKPEKAAGQRAVLKRYWPVGLLLPKFSSGFYVNCIEALTLTMLVTSIRQMLQARF